MKIGIVATHSFPIPYPNLHTGDVVILDLAYSLMEMGHEVTLYAPDGTNFPNLKVMRASLGKYPPTSYECEQECLNTHLESLLSQDIVHDFSVSKSIVQGLHNFHGKNTLCTIMGGAWKELTPPNNLVVWSQAHRDRVLRGATDYEGTSTPDLAGPKGELVKEAHVVYGGVCTDFYSPTYDKKDFYLWMGRWHPIRGYKQAIELARLTGINLIMAGEHPDRELFESQKQYAQEAIELASDLPNVKFEWLPPDPEHHVVKRELYRQAKAFLYTVQFQEPFGLSQAEALACGTPVVGFNFGSVPEVVSHGLTGYVVDNDIAKMASILPLVDKLDPQICRQETVKRFDRRVMAASYVKEYDTIINGRGW